VPAGGRQARVRLRTLDCDDIVGFELPFVLFDDGEHCGLDVHSVDRALRYHVADAQGEIAGACTYISHNIGRFELHMLNDLLWCFGLYTLRAFEPLCAGHAHHLGDLAAHIKFSDAIGMVLGTCFVHGRISAWDSGVLRMHARGTEQYKVESARPQSTPYQPEPWRRRHRVLHDVILKGQKTSSGRAPPLAKEGSKATISPAPNWVLRTALGLASLARPSAVRSTRAQHCGAQH